MPIDIIVEFIPPLEFDGIKDCLIMEPKMIDSKTLDEWDSETHIERCNIDKYAARNSILIEEIRRLLTENRTMREIIDPMLGCIRVEIAFTDKDGLSVMNFDPSHLRKLLSERDSE